MSFSRIARSLCAASTALLLIFSLAGCGLSDMLRGHTSEAVYDYIQGYLDMTYKGQYNDAYLEMCGITTDDARASYEQGLAVETDYFEQYFQLDYSDESLRADITAMYKQVYQQSRYTLLSSTKRDDGTWAVEIEIQPLDIVTQVVEQDLDGLRDQLWEVYSDQDLQDEDVLRRYDADWTHGIITLVTDRLQAGRYGYEETQSILVQVRLDEDDSWYVDNNDLGNIDNLILAY